MDYREYSPCDALARYVECYWVLESDDSSLAPHAPEKILPDGCMELIINYGEPFRRWTASAPPERQPISFIVGQMNRYIEVQPVEPAGVIGVRFHPGGAYPFLKFDQRELSGQIVPLDSVWSLLAPELEERIREARFDRARIDLLDSFFLSRLNGATNGDGVVDATVNRILALNGIVSIDTLAKREGISCRQLERRFNREVGISPKLLCRILRFQTIFGAFENADAVRLASVAAQCGYYDQAHFIRDFQEFSGEDPSSFLAEENELTRQFTRAKRMSDFYNTSEDR